MSKINDKSNDPELVNVESDMRQLEQDKILDTTPLFGFDNENQRLMSARIHFVLCLCHLYEMIRVLSGTILNIGSNDPEIQTFIPTTSGLAFLAVTIGWSILTPIIYGFLAFNIFHSVERLYKYAVRFAQFWCVIYGSSLVTLLTFGTFFEIRLTWYLLLLALNSSILWFHKWRN